MFGTILSINTDSFTENLFKLLFVTDTACVRVRKKYIYAVKPAYNGKAIDRFIFLHSQVSSAE